MNTLATVNSWAEMKEAALAECSRYDKIYQDRLRFEVSEIEKQGAGDYWLNIKLSGQVFDTNKNGLVLPFLLGITKVDPVAAGIKHIVEYQPDFPDVDVDLMPGVREEIEKYAADQYGADKVCAVGLWQTYKPKSALQDAARALQKDLDSVMKLTKNLPDEFDKLFYIPLIFYNQEVGLSVYYFKYFQLFQQVFAEQEQTIYPHLW